MDEKQSKPVIWIGSSHEDWLEFPDDVQDVMGYALHLAQCGEKANNAKPLTGFKGVSIGIENFPVIGVEKFPPCLVD